MPTAEGCELLSEPNPVSTARDPPQPAFLAAARLLASARRAFLSAARRFSRVAGSVIRLRGFFDAARFREGREATPLRAGPERLGEASGAGTLGLRPRRGA